MAAGDRVEVNRWLAGTPLRYVHHGIDMGDGTVVHARPHDFRKPFGGGSVVRTTLAEFADGAEVRTTLEPPAAFPAEDVARRAAAHVGRDGYCEHFATWCATGQRRSRQVEAVIRGVTAVAVAAVAILLTGRKPAVSRSA